MPPPAALDATPRKFKTEKEENRALRNNGYHRGRRPDPKAASNKCSREAFTILSDDIHQDHVQRNGSKNCF